MLGTYVHICQLNKIGILNVLRGFVLMPFLNRKKLFEE